MHGGVSKKISEPGVTARTGQLRSRVASGSGHGARCREVTRHVRTPPDGPEARHGRCGKNNEEVLVPMFGTGEEL